jgi:hypothetical protein
MASAGGENPLFDPWDEGAAPTLAVDLWNKILGVATLLRNGKPEAAEALDELLDNGIDEATLKSWQMFVRGRSAPHVPGAPRVEAGGVAYNVDRQGRGISYSTTRSHPRGTLLHCAAAGGCVQGVRRLLEKGWDPRALARLPASVRACSTTGAAAQAVTDPDVLAEIVGLLRDAGAPGPEEPVCAES